MRKMKMGYKQTNNIIERAQQQLVKDTCKDFLKSDYFFFIYSKSCFNFLKILRSKNIQNWRIQFSHIYNNAWECIMPMSSDYYLNATCIFLDNNFLLHLTMEEVLLWCAAIRESCECLLKQNLSTSKLEMLNIMLHENTIYIISMESFHTTK